MMKKLLLVVVFIGFVLRVWGIGKIPYGFTPDEASFGYDAYSILLTGKDQWGHKFPLVLESFGDYKPPLYSYILVPFIGLFGLGKSVVRLPNALAGTLAIYITYLMVEEFLGYGLRVKGDNKLARNILTRNRITALLASFLLAISSWHIMMSRAAFEANLTTLLMPLGILLFLKGLKNPRNLTFSALAFGLNLFSYHSAKLVTPLIVAFLVIIFKENLLSLKKVKLIIPAAILFVSVILTGVTFFQGAGTRAMDINIFKNSLGVAASERTDLINAGVPSNIARLIHNKYQVGLRSFVNNYLQYFSPNFLFTQGPAEATYGMIPGKGVLYWFELPFIFGFLIFLAKGKLDKLGKVILFWLGVAPIPASLATGPGYAANRADIMLPALYIALAFGAVELYETLRNNLSLKKVKVVLYSFALSALIFVSSFMENYFIRNPLRNAKAMLYPNLEASYFITNNYSDSKVYISKSLSEPHIYIAFAGIVDPNVFQLATNSWKYFERGLGWVDQLPEYSLANYTFKGIHIDEYANTDSVLIGKPDEFPENVNPQKIFYYPDGTPAIYIVQSETYLFAAK